MPVSPLVLRASVRLAATAAGLAAFLYACGWMLRPTPEPSEQVQPMPVAEAAAMEALRNPQLNTENPPTFWVDADYSQGEDASWWPKGEPGFLHALVEAGELPPVVERTGVEPLVIAGPDGVGNYGGTWLRAYQGDLGTVIRNYMGGGALCRWSPEGYPIVPHVAKGWEHSADYRVWTVYLREGMKWSDGQPLTADDFVYHYGTYWPFLNPGAPVGEMLHAGKQIRLEKVDTYTIRYVSEVPNPLFLERMTRVSLPCSPAHYYKNYIPEPGQKEEDLPMLQEAMRKAGIDSARFLVDRLIGFDNPEHPRLWPWIFRTHQETGTYVTVRNPYYFAVDTAGNQLPYMNQVVYQAQEQKMIPATAIGGGLTMQMRHLRFNDYTLLRSNEVVASTPYQVLHWYPGARSDFMLLPNLNRQPNPLDPQSAAKAELLKDKRFRRALSVAINRKSIIKSYYQGVGEPSQLEPGDYSPYHSEKLKHAWVQHDTALANALLDEAGLAQRDSEGYRTLPDGSPLVIYIHHKPDDTNGPLPLIVDDWKGVGIHAITRERASNLFTHEVTAGYPDFTVAAGNGEFHPLINPTFFLPFNQSSLAFVRYGGWYAAGGSYGNPGATSRNNYEEPPPGSPFREAIALYDQAMQEPSLDKRIALTQAIFDINADQVWSINISTPPPVPVVVDKELRNVPPVALQSYVYSTPNNAAKEAFYFATSTYPNGAPRDSESLLRDLSAQMLHAEPMPDFSTPANRGGSAAGAVLAKVLRWLFLLVLAATIVMIGLRHPFIGRRLLIMVPTMVVISIVTFTIIQAPPGDYIETYVARLQAEGESSALSRVEDLKEMFWLEDPMYVRYMRWLGLKWFVTFDVADTGLLQGNLGRSMDTQRPVNALVGDRILLTTLISAGTILFTWCLALPIGIYSAVRQYSLADYIFTFLGFFGMCVPGFLLALLLSYFGRAFLGVEMTGLFSPQYVTADWSLARVADLLKHIWVPVVVMGVTGTAGMIRVMRGNLLDELRKPYVTTARAKGVRPLKLLLKYPVRLALNPFISGIGGIFPQLVSGGAIVAIVLSLPTVGPQLLNSLMAEDMYFAGSLLMVLSLLSVFGMLVSDLLLLALDPRIRMEGRDTK